MGKQLVNSLVQIEVHPSTCSRHEYSSGPWWLNELGSWITQLIIQAYHQYGVGSHPAKSKRMQIIFENKNKNKNEIALP
jgi:hypothetical protein